MTQREVDRSVARATGEPVCTVRRIGFRLLGEPTAEGFRKPVCVITRRIASHRERNPNDRQGDS